MSYLPTMSDNFQCISLKTTTWVHPDAHIEQNVLSLLHILRYQFTILTLIPHIVIIRYPVETYNLHRE